MITDSLEYPFKNNIVDYLVGGFIWSIGAIFIFPFLLLYGYLVEVSRTTIQDEDAPPKFINISLGKILIDGLAYSTIAVIYWFIGALTIFLLVLSSVFIDRIFVYGLVGIITIVIYFFISYITRASILIYADKSKFEKCFSPRLLSQILLSKDFLIANIVLFTLIIAMMFTIFTITIIPIIGFIFLLTLMFSLPIIMFYYLSFKFRFLGLAYKEVEFKNVD